MPELGSNQIVALLGLALGQFHWRLSRCDEVQSFGLQVDDFGFAMRVSDPLVMLPIGGFSGYVRLLPSGERPPVPDAEPQRPGETDAAEENFEG